MPTLRLALAQLNVTVGDLADNRRLIGEAIRRAHSWFADLIVVPELAVPGYPPEDLLLKPQFIEANRRALRSLAPLTRGLTALVGYVDRDPQGGLSNAAAVLAQGRHVATYRKQCLPNYGVFDEKRYFIAGRKTLALALQGIRVGVTICEDLWEPWPAQHAAACGASLLVNLSASPYHAGKLHERERLFARRARENHLAIAYCNLVGGQDELVFDGASFVLDARGRRLIQGAQFREDLILVDVPLPPARRAFSPRHKFLADIVTIPRALADRPSLPGVSRPILPELEEIYTALTLGLRDYVKKNGFSTVVLGLSGGVDSALTACVAVDALGPSQVVGLVMPSRFSSAETQQDAKRVGQALGITVHELSIEPLFRAHLDTLADLFKDRPVDVAEQNLQARIRGTLLMALSNKFGWLVLTTGNKSEMATGYTTLYGDMAGGLAVIKDVPKTLVYRLARFRNARGPGTPIPQSVLERAPTAELAPHQTDQDTLPAYAMLDRILEAYVEQDRSLQEILSRLPAAPNGALKSAAQAGNRVDPETARTVLRMVDRSEYKRRQGPPGIKITPKAFGRDRRMPITNRFQQG